MNDSMSNKQAAVWSRFVLLLASLLLLAPEALTAQVQAGEKIRAAGRVLDEAGEPVVGATVVQKGGTVGVSTDAAGNFGIELPRGAVIVINFLGFEAREVTATEQPMAVILAKGSKALDDVIVIGYGTTTRRRAVGAVDQVKTEAIANRPVANLAQALQGTSPGLIIQQRSANPNDQQTNINIRGVGTMNNNDPLIVIDGLVSDNASFSKLNPNDIESVSVLKDAGTAAIYGSRGANGVLLVSTKKGQKNQAPVVQVSTMVGWERPEFLFKKVEGYQNATLKNVALANVGKDPEFTAEQIRDLYEHGNGEQFQNTILKDGFQQTYNVSVSGGSEHSTYMVSAGYFDQESNYAGPGYGIERVNFRTNLTTEYKRLKLTALMGYTRNNDKSTSGNLGNIAANVTRIPSYYYYRSKDPETGKYLTNGVVADQNPLGELEAGGFTLHDNDYINSNVGVDLQIVDGLKLRGVLGADVFRNHRYIRRLPVEIYDYQNLNSTPTIANSNHETEDWNEQIYLVNMQLMADYEKYFGKHHVTAMVGASNESFSSTKNGVKILFADVDLGIAADGSEVKVADQAVTPGNTNKTSITSVFGRAGYDYGDRYYAEASFRYDGSSKFEKAFRWGFFPSISAGWRVAQESFMDFYRDNVGDLKVRLSYGTLGNQNVDSYQYMTTYQIYSDTYAFDNSIAAGAGFKAASENLQWEVSRTLNVGLDASFLNDRLTLGLDVFNKNTDHILVTPQVPDIYGTTPQNYNAGAMRTQGWEVTLGYRLKTGGVNHSFAFNMGDSWNEVVSFEGYESFHKNDEMRTILREGLPLRSYYAYKTDGFFQTQAEIDSWATLAGVTYQPGDVKYVDRNGDGVINDNDWFYLGNAFPRYTFGFNYGLEWKGIDFSLFLQGVLKRDMLLRGELVEPFHSGYGYTMYEHQLDYWTPTNTDARYPRLAKDAYSFTTPSDLFVYDGAYLRVKNIVLGYTLPESLSKRAGIGKARIYVNAQNLFTFSNMSFVDPESSEFGNDMGKPGANSARNYPSLKYYGMGLDLTF
ncbi:MAG: TonB-dependent receptor [Prevotellaceae bacterium]|jgi:TonB-linked SusC/RagA family outer membrane protein|nr:TonB-dependent receptor [Prevotellaceae bacterium]